MEILGNNVRKGENAYYQHFLLSSMVFKRLPIYPGPYENPVGNGEIAGHQLT